MSNQTVSIVQVAERAGVSIATASRVISNANYPVSLQTRQKVLTAASDLNYTPNSLARSLKTKRSNLIAVLVGDSADPYFAEIMRGVEEVANQHGYLTIVCNTDRQPDKELHYLQTLRDYRADGIIFAGGGLNEPGYPEKLATVIQEMRQRDTAVITLAQHTLPVPTVQADNFGGARTMTARLLELGHHQIAFVTGPSNLVVANLRLQGYLTALAEAGIAINPNWLLSGNFSREGGELAAQGWNFLPADQRPSAIFAANDETAFGLLLGLKRLGYSVPEDVSVCGFGDLPLSQLLVPSLTTVHIALRELGRQGVTQLLAMLNDQPVPPSQVWPTHVVERGSTAPFVAAGEAKL